MTLRIYRPPEDKAESKPLLCVYPQEAGEDESPVIVQYVTQERAAYQRPIYVSPWDPADTL